jgi:hypothetical protein
MTGILRVEWTDADRSLVALIGEGNDNEYGRPLAIDVGSRRHLRRLGGPLLGLAWIGVPLWVLALVTVALPYFVARGAPL